MDETDNPLPSHKRSVSLVQRVMNELTEKIREGRYSPGDKLPTEPRLMAEQGVSRTVIREAVSRLQAAGMVETRRGVGTFVLSSPGPSPRPVLDISTVVTIQDVLSMLELRILFETEAAGLAAMRRTDEQLVSMRRTLEEMKANLIHGNSSVETDFWFHLHIAQATQNKYFEDIFNHLGTQTIPRMRLDTSHYLPGRGQEFLLKVNIEHENILDAITRKDPAAARAAMCMHLSNSRERLKQISESKSEIPDDRGNGS